ncbi:hypothetical protein GGS23DRAFT_548751 [Durotheca rogersii]|uniref:uncharacterized protein n=1 Tax=Durotheca rogersii TaxID=419775 RepID=UPI00221F7ED8|nr:uncharacterized protein GGS23DRAFT_548751 [Durotheca rogersii]KAI5867528.1 hypothetical protein GGS23DRAFT_548751 [Durotheca rogersii]
MAEASNLVATVEATLEQSLGLLERLISALSSDKDLCQLLRQHGREVSRINRLVGLISAEQALKIEDVQRAIEDVGRHGKKLKGYLQSTIQPLERGTPERAASSLFSDPGDKANLQNIMQDLGHSKVRLISYTLLYNVGLVRNSEGLIKVNKEALENLNASMRAVVGTSNIPRIQGVIQGREVMDDGTITLTSEDTATLSLDSTGDVATDSALKKVEPKERIIQRNKSLQRSLMLNSPVSEVDTWRDIDKLTIQDNTSDGESMMFNHPIPESLLASIVKARSGSP